VSGTGDGWDQHEAVGSVGPRLEPPWQQVETALGTGTKDPTHR